MSYFYVIIVGASFCITWLITRLCKWFRRQNFDIQVRDVSKGHRWCSKELFTQQTFCNVSGNLVMSGAYCDSCGICVEERNMKIANKKVSCKSLSIKSLVHNHHWVKGNLPALSVCCICESDCGNYNQLKDFKCCWCWETVHEKCRSDVSTKCSLGPYKQFIVPPNCVSLKQVGIKGMRKWMVSEVKQPNIPNWKPLIVIANRKSGNGDGENILQTFRGILNPSQVIDLCDLSPECALEWCRLLPQVTFRVIVAGGDGTVGWILNAIDNLKLKPTPNVAILPLGTGNDLSRVLGWGEGHSGEVDAPLYLQQLEDAQIVRLDRWRVNILPFKQYGIPRRSKRMVANNYVSIGVDALVTLNFHLHRESSPMLFSNRIMNKFWYFTYGTKDVYERECKDLEKKMKLELDGKEITLPQLEGVVILNIASWGAGCHPWQIGTDPNTVESRYDDELLEVFGLYSSFHIAQLQVGLAEPYRIGQAKKVKITLCKGKAPMQVDGEPWEQHPGEIFIDFHNRITMLSNTR